MTQAYPENDIACEYRIFYVYGKAATCFCNALRDADPAEVPAELVARCTRLGAPFYTVDFEKKNDGEWTISGIGDGQVTEIPEGQNKLEFCRALHKALAGAPARRWCLVGNIVETREYGEEKEVRRGTKHFSGGTKVYIAPIQWDDGYERVVVIGKPRYRKSLVEVIVDRSLINNFRVQKVLKPTVLHRMCVSRYNWWGNSDRDREAIECVITCLRDKICNALDCDTSDIMEMESEED